MNVDCDRVADALIRQHPRIHLRGSKHGNNSNTRWFRGKGKGKHTGNGKSGASAYYGNFTSADDYDHDDDVQEPADADQAPNDRVEPGSDDGEEALDVDDGMEE